LPVGAVVLLSDGSENSARWFGRPGLETINALRNRRIPVHTVGFGKEQAAHDVELNDVRVASRAMADSRIPATVTFHQRGYAGSKALLVVRDGDKTLGSREVTLGADGATQVETIFSARGAGVKSLHFSLGPLANEENVSNNAVTRLLGVTDDKRRILYVEGEPRWEYKFIRRAEDDDKIVQVASMLRTTENKIYRQGSAIPRNWRMASRCVRKISLPTRASSWARWRPATSPLCNRNCCASSLTAAAAGCFSLAGASRLGMEDGAARAWWICCRRFSPTAGPRSTAIRRPSNLRPRVG
jgi:hypothetical protein